MASNGRSGNNIGSCAGKVNELNLVRITAFPGVNDHLYYVYIADGPEPCFVSGVPSI